MRKRDLFKLLELNKNLGKPKVLTNVSSNGHTYAYRVDVKISFKEKPEIFEGLFYSFDFGSYKSVDCGSCSCKATGVGPEDYRKVDNRAAAKALKLEKWIEEFYTPHN